MEIKQALSKIETIVETLTYKTELQKEIALIIFMYWNFSFL